MAVVTEAKTAGKTVITYNIHLESKGDDDLRCAQLSETLDDARSYDANVPIVLADDSNLDVSQGTGAAAGLRTLRKPTSADDT